MSIDEGTIRRGPSRKKPPKLAAVTLCDMSSSRLNSILDDLEKVRPSSGLRLTHFSKIDYKSLVLYMGVCVELLTTQIGEDPLGISRLLFE